MDLRLRLRCQCRKSKVHHQHVGATRKRDELRVAPRLIPAEHDTEPSYVNAIGQRGCVRVGHTDRCHLEIAIFQDRGHISVIHVDNRNVEKDTVSCVTDCSAKNRKCAVGAIEHSIQERRNAREERSAGWSRYLQGLLPSTFAQPQQCRKIGHVVRMKVGDRKKREIVKSSSRLTESKERTSSYVDHHGRPASAPYQVTAGRSIRTGERSSRTENLYSSRIGATLLSNYRRSDWLDVDQDNRKKKSSENDKRFVALIASSSYHRVSIFQRIRFPVD